MISSNLVSAQSLNSRDDDVLVIATTKKELVDFPIIRQKPGKTDFLRSLLTPPLVVLSQNGTWICQLCDRPPVRLTAAKNKKENKIVTEWQLKKNLRWLDGEPITSSDVQHTFSALRSKSENKKQERKYKSIAIKISKKDPLKFWVTFPSYRRDYMQALSLSLTPSHKAKQKQKDAAFIEKKFWKTTDSRLIKLMRSYQYGPYKIDRVDFNEITLSQNSLYFLPTNGLHKLKFKLFSKEVDLRNHIRKNLIDMIVDGAVQHSFIRRNEKLLRYYRIQSAPDKLLEQLVINLNNPELADANLRKALFLSLDRNKLLDLVFFGHGKVAKSIISSTKSVQHSDGASYFNLDKARIFLKRSGWHYNPTDEITRKNGRSLTLELITDKSLERRTLVQFITESWKKIGISVQHKPVSKKDLRSTLKNRRFRDIVLCSISHYPNANWLSRFHSQARPQDNNAYTGFNFMSWSNRKVDNLFKEESYIGKPDLLEEKLDTLVFSELPLIPLIYRPKFIITSDRISNIQISSSFFPSTTNLSTWQRTEKQPIIF